MTSRLGALARPPRRSAQRLHPGSPVPFLTHISVPPGIRTRALTSLQTSFERSYAACPPVGLHGHQSLDLGLLLPTSRSVPRQRAGRETPGAEAGRACEVLVIVGP